MWALASGVRFSRTKRFSYTKRFADQFFRYDFVVSLVYLRTCRNIFHIQDLKQKKCTGTIRQRFCKPP